MNKLKKNRVEYIDIAKGIGILLVIVGHIDNLPAVIKNSIYSFHMPLFFIISGLFFREDSIKQAVKRMFSSLIIPYLVVGCILRIGKMIINYINDITFDIEDLFSIIGVCWKFNGNIVSVGAIWFLVVLFLSKLFLLIALKYKNGVACLIVIATLSIIFTKYFHIVFPFGIQQACVCSLFVYIGYWFKKLELLKRTTPKMLIVALFVSVLPFTAKFWIATRVNDYPFGIFNIITSSVVSVLLIYILKFFFEYGSNVLQMIKRFFIWCGQYSLVILAVHSIETAFFAFHSYNWMFESLIRVVVILLLSWVYITVIIFKNENTYTSYNK